MGHRYREFLFISSGCDVLRSPRLALSSREKTAILYPTPKQHSLGVAAGLRRFVVGSFMLCFRSYLLAPRSQIKCFAVGPG